MPADTIIIDETKAWLKDVVVGCNFCPFVARELKSGRIHYKVVSSATTKISLEALAFELERLDDDKTIETTLIIFPDDFSDFYKYLELTDLAERFIKKQGKEGIYQVASFHPRYLFAGSTDADPANYTNRSLYPMLHILREDSLTNALAQYPHPEKIPQNNIEYARRKGLEYMKVLRDSCRIE